ncbi:Uncharacterised protein [Burkholderia pseudomallei]|nr:Uncharacterised protein [Burkholderia pseudomallei]CAK0502291.1 Uncharacterised protein [Burkholderia pseudomallei]
MGFVHDDELGTKFLEGFATTFGLDVVQADHSEWIGIEYRGTWWQVSLQPVGSGGAHYHCLDVEALRQLALPLLTQMRGAQYGNALYFATVQHLSGNQGTLDGFTDADIISYQQPNGRQFHRH